MAFEENYLALNPEALHNGLKLAYQCDEIINFRFLRGVFFVSEFSSGSELDLLEIS